jgi:lipid A disaccharide synthetase
MEGLIEGRIVHYVCPQTMAHRPAIVVNVKDKEDGNCDIFVFGLPEDGGFFMRTDCIYNAEAPEGTWHWTEKA